MGAADGAGVDETRWLEEQSTATGFPNAIVVAADLTSADLGPLLDSHQAASGRLRGIRQIVSRRADEGRRSDSPALLRDERFFSGLRQLAERDLSFDLQLTPPYPIPAAKLLSRLPDLRVALCHLGSPSDQSPEGLATWERDLRAFASLPRSYCKLSGLAMLDPGWTRESLAPLIAAVLTAFPATRIMWGSNFPVDKLYRGYRETAEAVGSLIPKEQREQIFFATAAEFYRL